MAQPYLGQITLFAGTYAPNGWKFCDGTLLSIADNNALYSLVGTTYGGDGVNTFGLPDMRGRVPVHMGTGPGMSYVAMGESGGVEEASLNSNQLPAHQHPFTALVATGAAATGNATHGSPIGNLPASGAVKAYTAVTPTIALNAAAIVQTGGGQPHANLMPFACVNYIIALNGIYPSRN